MNTQPIIKRKTAFGQVILACLFLLAVQGIRAQVAVDPRTEEYATVRAVLSLETGTFSQAVTKPNPFLELEGMAMELKDYVKDAKGAKFESVTDMLNYMNKFSWVLLGFETVELKASNTDYLVLYTFKRKPKK